jgi:hypothetical protein
MGSGRSWSQIPRNLDLLAFPTIIFGETGYSIYVLRQASRRSWRIGQKQAVRVKFLHYARTMQESCLRLMGKKLLVSLALEGKFANDDDMLTAMARELVTQKGVGERADNVWRQLQRQTPALVAHPEVAQSVPLEEFALPVVAPVPLPPCPTSPLTLADFALPVRRIVRRPVLQPDENQLSLAF